MSGIIAMLNETSELACLSALAVKGIMCTLTNTVFCQDDVNVTRMLFNIGASLGIRIGESFYEHSILITFIVFSRSI